MYIPRDPEFLHERKQFALRHCCEECVFFCRDPQVPEKPPSCAHGWPNAEHRSAHYEAAPDLLVFCKEFEIP